MPDYYERQGKRPIIKLETKKGEFHKDGIRCSRCGGKSERYFAYSKSSHGTVALCPRCNAHVLDYSFGKVDAFRKATLSGFETKRSKH
jgi:hypothetical protein